MHLVVRALCAGRIAFASPLPKRLVLSLRGLTSYLQLIELVADRKMRHTLIPETLL